MAHQFDYTKRARHFTARFPALSYAMIQINLWVIANVMLAVLAHLFLLIAKNSFLLPIDSELLFIFVWGITIGIIQGSLMGLGEYYLNKYLFRRMAMGRVIILQTLVLVVILFILYEMIRYVIYDSLISPILLQEGNVLSDVSWNYGILLLLIYFLFANAIISFINLVNKKYGPGILVPILLGKYRSPKEEERIFLFMDLKSSTTIAEDIGHLRYSSFIQECFLDINHVSIKYDAEIYQYVGDGIVISWDANPTGKLSSVQFFYACEKEFELRQDYYLKNFGIVPVFKAGVHSGIITAVEIGDFKRDIAFHGDTINTAARIQSLCNEYNKKILVSRTLLLDSELETIFKTQSLGEILLKGKIHPVEIVSVE